MAGGYQVGIELLLINALITFTGFMDGIGAFKRNGKQNIMELISK